MAGYLVPAVFTLSALVAGVVATLAWRRRAGTPAAAALAGSLGGTAWWSAGDAVLYAPVPGAVRSVALSVLYVGVGATTIGLYALSRIVADPGWRLSRRAAVLLALEPLAVAVAVALPATRSALHPLLPLDGPAADVQLGVGPAFLAHCAWSYGLLAVALAHLVRRWGSAPPLFRRQVGVLLLGVLPPTIGNVVSVVGLADGRGVELTPVFFVVTGLLDAYAVFRLGLLRVVPVARGQVVETMEDAVLVVDPAGRVVDVNPAAVRLLGRFRPALTGDLVGRPVTEVAGEQMVRALAQAADRDGHKVAVPLPGLYLDVRSTPVTDPRGRALGVVVVVRDVSTEQQRQLAVEQLNEQLLTQLDVIEGLQATLAEEAVRDPLTGLHNRRHLDRVLADELLRSADDGTDVAVVVFDVDRFKSVNDRYGHATGDVVLVSLADALRTGTRPGDTVARLGGEEFVLVLPGADQATAVARAEDVRARCAAVAHEVPDGALRVTVSAGVAAGPADGTRPGDLLAAADRALYRAKADGRDRVASASAAHAGAPAAVPAGAPDVLSAS